MRLSESYIGAVSSGTMREEDLIPRLEKVLDEANVAYDRPKVVDKLLDGEELNTDEWERVSVYLHEDLWEAINDIAPEGCYFGANEVDGASYGFWHIDPTDDA